VPIILFSINPLPIEDIFLIGDQGYQEDQSLIFKFIKFENLSP